MNSTVILVFPLLLVKTPATSSTSDIKYSTIHAKNSELILLLSS